VRVAAEATASNDHHDHVHHAHANDAAQSADHGVIVSSGSLTL